MLSRALGDLIVAGCNRGALFEHCHFQWLDLTDPSGFNIHWDRLQLPPYFPLQPWITTSLDPEVLAESEWWLLRHDDISSNAKYPLWWDIAENNVKVSTFA